MGFKLHSAKKFDVQYGTHSSFGNCYSNDINRALYKLIPDLVYNSDCLEFADELEILKEELVIAIATIRQTKEPIVKNLNNEFFANELQTLLDQSDPDLEYVRLDWF